MKTTIPLRSCLALSLLLAFSCKKDNNSGQNNTSGSSLVRIQEGIDPDITNDSVYLIKYNASKKIASITDSLNQDTLTATYDASTGNLSSITETYGTNASFAFDGNGLLTQVSYYLAGSSEQYRFEYTNGVVSKKSYYSNLGSGSLSLQGYFTYTFANGNITSMTEYTKSGVLVVTTNFSYGTQTNPFKDLSLFNYADNLGTVDVMNFETYFNTNILTGAAWNGVSIAATNTFSANQQLSKLVAYNNYQDYIETWMFSYK